MDESHNNASQAAMPRFALQHNAMLKACCQIADLDLPPIVRTLEQSLVNAANGPLKPVEEDARENIAVARLALEFHREVKRQLRARHQIAWQ